MIEKPKLIVGLGELLWDLLPGGKQLGGAPANFAVMSARLGDHGVIASRIGQDALGEETRNLLDTFTVDAQYVQLDKEHDTGSVSVVLESGQPEYVFHQPVAWDFLEQTPAWAELARRADAVCFGTLAQRHDVSRATIQSFLRATSERCVRIFDVNLRPPFYNADLLGDSFRHATLVKLNEIEIPIVVSLLGLAQNTGSDEASLLRYARLLFDRFPSPKLICITMGSLGSLLVTRQEYHHHRGVPTKVVDTVGAGDAFTAAMVHTYLRNAPLAVVNEAGNRWGSWVASQRGAMPALSAETRTEIEK